MKIVFLGTGGSYPSKERNLSSVALKMNGDVILFDCGEGTQRQIMFTDLSFMKVTTILFSHFHGDHFLGVPGLVQTMYLNDREAPLELIGPPGTVKRLTRLLGVGHFNPTFEIRVTDMDDGDVLERADHTIRAAWVKHGVPCMAFSVEEKPRPGRFNKQRALELGIPEGPLFRELQQGQSVEVDGKTYTPDMVLGPPRRGRKVVYATDTAPTDNTVELAKGADVLIHDSTGTSEIEEKMNDWGHSTAGQAAEIARKAGVKRLYLYHISARYKDSTVLEEEARKIFRESFAAEDFLEYVIPLPSDDERP